MIEHHVRIWHITAENFQLCPRGHCAGLKASVDFFAGHFQLDQILAANDVTGGSTTGNHVRRVAAMRGDAVDAVGWAEMLTKQTNRHLRNCQGIRRVDT